MRIQVRVDRLVYGNPGTHRHLTDGVSELKIDGVFVRNVRANTPGATLLESTIALGKRMGLSVVAECAETADDWLMLKALGCDYMQGWFAAKAMPEDDFMQWWAANDPFVPLLPMVSDDPVGVIA